MTYLAHIFAGIGLFFASFFGTHFATVPVSGDIAVSTSSTQTTSGSVPVQIGYTRYYKDATKVYIQDSDEKYVAIAYADPKTFTLVKPQSSDSASETPYVKDANHVWYLGQRSFTPQVLVGVDASTFQEVGQNVRPGLDANGGDFYAKDKSHVYFNGGILSSADPSSFVFLGTESELDAKDQTHTYWDGDIVSTTSSTTCSSNTSDSGLVIVGETVCWNNTQIPEADPATVHVANGMKYYSYLLDKSHVWTVGNSVGLLPGVDPQGFAFIDWWADGPGFMVLTKNNEHVYLNNTIVIPGADPATFSVVADSQYEKDAHAVFYLAGLVPGADLATFKTDVCNEGTCSFDAHDKNHTYFEGAVVK